MIAEPPYSLPQGQWPIYDLDSLRSNLEVLTRQPARDDQRVRDHFIRRASCFPGGLGTLPASWMDRVPTLIQRGEIAGHFPLSYSRVDRWDECPRWYSYENVERLGRVGSDPMQLGNALHEYLEMRIREGNEQADAILSALIPLKESDEFFNMKKLVDQVFVSRDNLISLEERYFFAEQIRTPSWYADLFPGYHANEITVDFQAKIDVLFIYPDGTAEIVDWKSGRKLDEKIDNDPQLKLYALTVLRNFPHVWRVIPKRVDLRFNRIINGNPKSQFHWEAGFLEDFSQVVRAKFQAIADDREFGPKPNDHCEWCPFAIRCDAAEKFLPQSIMFGDQSIPVHIDETNAQKIAAGLLQAKAKVKKIEEMVQHFVEFTKSPLSAGEEGYVWDYHKRATQRVDVERFIEIFESIGRDWRPYVSVNNQKTRTIKNGSSPSGIPAVVELYKEAPMEEYSWWGYGKSKDDDD